jgi:DNA polymerase I
VGRDLETQRTTGVSSGDSQALLLIVDGHAFAYRAYHAIKQLTSPGGSPTNAIFGFVKMLARMQAKLHPTHQVVVWDGGLAAERLAMLPGYKAQRPPMPEALARQLTEICGYLTAARVTWRMREGVEADDWIAALTGMATAVQVSVVIASSDKDFLQLLSPRVGLLNPHDKSEAVWGPAEVRAKTGIEPVQVVDWLSLIGDTVDNIPGVEGVGPKTATNLLQQFGSVAALYARLDEVRSPLLRDRLKTAEPLVQRNQELIRLKGALPENCEMADLRVQPGDAEQLRQLYATWGFRSLLAELESGQLRQGDLF